MRTRRQIETVVEDMKQDAKSMFPKFDATRTMQDITIELLLDIRDLLANK